MNVVDLDFCWWCGKPYRADTGVACSPECAEALDSKHVSAQAFTAQHQIRAFSYGGGVQSTAALVLAAQRQIDWPLFIFANVGDDSEHPATIQYVREIAGPYAAREGVELVERERGGVNRSLLHKIERLESSLPIPIRMDRTGAPGNRSCTQDFKIDVIDRELKARGATADKPALVAFGITTDEVERVRSAFDPRQPAQRRRYPLIDLRLNRQDCKRIITDAGLPIPHRSACWFCPYHSGEEWRRLKDERSDLFERACELEEMLQRRRAALGRDPVWLTDQGARQRATLRVLHAHDQLSFDTDASCDGGVCMT